ncbi:uncharacterized protein A1O9_12169 [Exophiala aquamarina CBS 119918]|uniref:Adenosinetriphosphatase n=1 Tax=Exophiala aquamarina CBS 119918 TaxID=1182545 RepID=A0A072NWN7_9EURO|nr:uncharacterized protein A1O9_12169 [Exophiala aquamarina CBS 119918]KEF51832.1 hypothetical protein A1O9_12169 [Exophiala aquamarina CBS 119918]
MVREQEPPRNPLAPSMGNTAPPQKPQDQGKSIGQDSAAALQPEFGKPTALGASPQLYSRTQPLVRPTANVSAPRQVSGSQNDKYSNLFVPAKKPTQRPELHRPQINGTNPLQAFRDIKSGSHQSHKPTLSAPTSNDDDDVFEIPRPSSFPTWQPRPISQPTFSSQTSTNPYYQPQSLIDLTLEKTGFATNRGMHDQEQFYSSTDPYTYVDAAKANENIKALLEGAFEDEEDQSRTRRRKKALEAKLDKLTDKVKGMDVNGEDKNEDVEEEDEDEDEDGTINGLKVKLLPHQIDGVNWMRDKETGTKKTRGVLPKGGILADDMGLGKTIQSIALMLTNPKPSKEELEKSKRKLPEDIGKGTLVVAPLALIKQWEGEIKDRIEEEHALKVCVHHGPGRAKSYKDLKKYDVVITTYHTLSSEHAGSEGSLKVGCFGIHWYRVILDEAHSIKNRNAKATKAASALESEYRWCLTGTPMQNNLDELQSLIHFLRIKPYDDLNTWREQITKPMNNGRGGLALRRLQVYLKAFMKRRTKDILKQDGALKSGKGKETATGKGPGFKIVARTVEKVEAQFTEQEREFYSRLESRTDRSLEAMMAGNKMSYASALVLLMRLRQACNHPMLTGSDLASERDAIMGSQTPSRQKSSADDDMDSIANMLGGLSVQTKRCDMCQTELSAREASGGAIRCTECETDLEKQNINAEDKKRTKREKRVKKERKAILAQRTQARRVINDSDDEDSDQPEDKVGEEEISDDDYSSEGSTTSPEPSIMQSAKIRHLIQILNEDAHNHKYIVFSFFTSMLNLIEPFLKANRIRYVRYDGQMRNDAREASLNSLRNDPSTRVLLCSLRAGSLGLNLTAASRVVILEPFWNPFVEEQAIDRVHRLNQTIDVKVYKFTIKDTVEERILELQEKKRELANATIEGKKGGMKLTLQDMMNLFGRDAEREHPVNVNEIGGNADGAGPRGRGLLDPSSGASQPSPADISGVSRSSTVSSTTSSIHAPLPARDRERDRERDKERYGAHKKPLRNEYEMYGRRW